LRRIHFKLIRASIVAAVGCKCTIVRLSRIDRCCTCLTTELQKQTCELDAFYFEKLTRTRRPRSLQ